MPRWLKITIGLTASLIILVVIGGYIFSRMLMASLPNYSGQIYSSNVSFRVEIYRDQYAIPYIAAQSDEDASFVLGYVHAQDRLFTMDLARRAGEGRLSEVFGTQTIPFDKMFLTVGINETVKRIMQNLNSEAKKFLDAYAAGVNHYIKAAGGKFPVEFDVLGYDPEPWKPEHSLIIGRLMAWELNISWWTDIAFTHLIQKFGEAKFSEIIPDYPENAPVIIPPELKNYPLVSTSLIETDKTFRRFMGYRGTHIGSNNWVVNGKMSESKKPLIANDAHLAFSAPGKWYLVVIKSPGLNVEGFTLPGLPAVVIGKNQNISWAVTNIMADDSDFYIEHLDSSRTSYRLNNEWKKLIIREETIKVKDSSDVVIEVMETHRGPIISGIHPYDFLYENKNVPAVDISMKWLGNELSDEFLAFMKINKASNWNDFTDALETFAVPGQNFVYADKQGNIGYVFGGKLPLREINSSTFIFEGTTTKYDWKGTVPRQEIPVLFNPQSNFIASANNKTLRNFKYHISNLWEPSSRYERIVELLSSKQIHTEEDFMKYQTDFVSPYARELTAHILSAFKGVEIKDANLSIALELLKQWDFEMNQYSQTPAIYNVFLVNLLRNIYLDEMGDDLFNQFIFVGNVAYRSLYKVLRNPQCSWIDDITTPEVETLTDIIRKSMVDALVYLEKKYGKEIKDWQWGKIHKVKFKHAFSGISSLLDKYIDIGPYEIGGDGTTIFNTEYAFSEGIKEFPAFDHEPFENDLGPSMRYIFDFAKPDEFYAILPTGQSGNVMSDHYRDMTEMWREGKYIKVKTDLNSIRNSGYKLLTIIPSSEE